MEDRTIGSLFGFIGATIMWWPIVYLVRIALSLDSNPVNSFAPFWLGFGVGVYSPVLSSAAGILCIVLIYWGSYVMSKKGREIRGAKIIVVFSLISLIFIGGGFFIGTILVLVGGLLGRQSTKWDYSG